MTLCSGITAWGKKEEKARAFGVMAFVIPSNSNT